MRHDIAVFLFAAFCLSCTGSRSRHALQELDPWHYTPVKNLVTAKAAVVSAHPLASMAGVAVMKQGGNAFDAAIATQLALAVVYPAAGNLGGGGFMVARTADGKLLALDYRETAPAASNRDLFLDDQGNIIPGKSLYGPLSAGIPGTVAGIFETLPHALLPFEKLVDPAIALAENGFAITRMEASSLNMIRDELDVHNTMVSAFQKAQSWKEGDTLVQKDLAATLKRIRKKGRKGFYEGETARLIVEEMKRSDGIITLEDLRNYRAEWRQAHRFHYRGHEIISMPLPSSGGLLLNQMLGMVEDHPMGKYGFHSAASVQLMTEVERRAFADRSEWMGDPAFHLIPMDTLTSREYLKRRISDFVPGIAGSSEITGPGNIPGYPREQTTHISIVDGNGNMVAITTTLNNSYGSKTVVGNAGFFLNDEMDDFSISPGQPNLYGAVGGSFNAIAPGKRMLSSMTPTLVLRGGKPFLVLGTPGGTTIPTTVFQVLVNMIDFGLPADAAVNSPRFHHQWLPDRVDAEPDFPAKILDELRTMGYNIHFRGSIGRVELIQFLENGLQSVADGRGDDSAAGF